MRLIQLVFAGLVSVFACTACYWLVALNVMTRVTALQLAIDGQPELAGQILAWQAGKEIGYAPTTSQTGLQFGSNPVSNWTKKGFPWGQIKPGGYRGATSFICDGPFRDWVITSDYGDPRQMSSGESYPHSAFDYAVKGQSYGSPSVKTPMGGKVVYAKFYSGDAYGNLVVVENNGVLLYLAHLNSFSVNEGDVIRAGDTVGIMGSTGPSTGPHVHIEYRHDDNTPLDPRLERVPGQNSACNPIYP